MDLVFIRHEPRRRAGRVSPAARCLPCRLPAAQSTSRPSSASGKCDSSDDTASGEPSGIPPSSATSIVDSSSPGFARVFCPECRAEFLVAFSCKGRGLCPSCGAKRAAIFSELLPHKILADVPHAQWVRSYFLFHRELLGDLARLAYETVREMMVAAVDQPLARPGMVAGNQTFGSSTQMEPAHSCHRLPRPLPH